jgi:uncharacterized protein (DUF433 family)
MILVQQNRKKPNGIPAFAGMTVIVGNVINARKAQETKS